MKRFYCLILPLLLAVACAGGAEEIVLGDVMLDVKVESPVAPEVVVVYHNDMIPVRLDDEGNAQVALSGVDAAYLKLYHGREMLRLYVEGGDIATLTFKGGRMSSTYAFEGEKQPVVKYLNTVSLVSLPDEDYAVTFDDYTKRLSAKENDALKLLNANECSKIGDFKKMEEGRIRYSYAAALMMYPVGHALMARNPLYTPEEAYYEAIREYASFGAGFRIALRDLELRGAGNLLGAEQHGHLDAVGYDLYVKLLQEAVLAERGEAVAEKTECVVTLSFDACLPERYVRSATQRMALYKRISLIGSQYDLEDMTDELLDRYGELPRAASNLLRIALIRSLAQECGITQIRQDGGDVHICSPELNVDVWMELSARFPGKLRMMLSANPYIRYRIEKSNAALENLIELFLACKELSLKKGQEAVDK